MEAASLVLSATQAVLAALQRSDLKKICSLWGYESELVGLQDTVSAIRSVLLDAEAKRFLSHQESDFIDKLKAAVYDAEDLLDEFTTLSDQQLLEPEEGSRGVSKKARSLFCRLRRLGLSYTMSQEVKRIRNKLDGIAGDAGKFCFKVDNQPLRWRREETCSYVYDKNVIGREREVEEITNMLVDTNNADGDVSVLSIVGMGGLGKTTLAQLVFNDTLIQEEFQLRLWVCVGDQDPKQLDVEAILCKILKSATYEKDVNNLGLESLQRKVREILDGNKYLLVLDDLWTEDRVQWLKLENFLTGGARGSWIVVTTRSLDTARAVGNGPMYELEGLSNEASLQLFHMVAFGKEQGEVGPPGLAELSQDIVDKCAGVPLAIRVVGSLLFGQEKDKWEALKERDLASIRGGENGIMPILKLSYDHLDSPLKSCFSYCALFPKDRLMEKEMLIRLWMAQGYVEPLYDGQSIEEAGEDYFMIFLRRCFFQYVEKNKYGEVERCAMHDLMHDLAQEAAGKEMCIADSNTSSVDKSIRHVNDLFGTDRSESFFSQSRRMRTYLCRTYLRSTDDDSLGVPVSALLEKWKFLRALDLSFCRIQSLPNLIGKLLHLRYLDLSGNSGLRTLPESIAKLQNLQTLNVSCCTGLRELPRDLSKLINLRVLNIRSCFRLAYLPTGMGKLTSLRKLSEFIVGQVEVRRFVGGQRNKETNRKQQERRGEMIGELRKLRNLKGELTISIGKDYHRNVFDKEGEVGGYLSNKQGLTRISLQWDDDDRIDDEAVEALVEELQPHSNVMYLKLYGYQGARLVPRWARGEMLPNLVEMELSHCPRLQELPPRLAELPCLKKMALVGCPKLEYIESGSVGDGDGVGGSTFFPSLEDLKLENLPELKGWWREMRSLKAVEEDDEEEDDEKLLRHGGRGLPWFPRLSTLWLSNCPSLTSCMPLCPTVEHLRLTGRINEKLRIILLQETQRSSLASLSNYGSVISNPKWISLEVSDVGCLKSVPMGKITSRCMTLSRLIISEDGKIERGLGEYEEAFRACSSSLRHLTIQFCYNLSHLRASALHHLTALESLTLTDLPQLFFDDDDDDDDDDDHNDVDGINNMPWTRTLRELRLHSLPKVNKLPQWIQHCASLTQLWIFDSSPLLKERCRNPDGEDWPLIQHIPYVSIY